MVNNVNIIVFTIIAVLGYGMAILLTKYTPFKYIPIPAGVFYITALILTYYFLPSHGKVEGYENSNSFESEYSKLDHLEQPSKLFKVTPAKKCCLFPNEPGCENISQEEKDCVCCGKGFHGRPVHFEYTPESNINWESTRCKENNQSHGCSSGPLTLPVL